MLLPLLSLGRLAMKHRNKEMNEKRSPSPPRQPRSGSWWLRVLAIIPVITISIAFLLACLCVFAGNKPGMMDEYAVFTLNVSRLGENMLQDLDNKISSVNFNKRSLPVQVPAPALTNIAVIAEATPAPTTFVTKRGIKSDISSLESRASSDINSATSAIESHVTSLESAAASVVSSGIGAVETKVIEVVNNAYHGLISDLQLDDFYAIHISSSCVGTYEFKNGTNVTVGNSALPANKGANSVHANVDKCSAHSAIDPMSLIKFIYWVGIALTGVALVLGVVGLVLLPTSRGQQLAVINIIATLLAFTFIFLASSVTHGLALGAEKFINFVGGYIGIAGYKGTKFLSLTWSCTGLLLFNALLWAGLLVMARRMGIYGDNSRRSRSRPDRTSQIVLDDVSQPQRVFDRHGQMI